MPSKTVEELLAEIRDRNADHHALVQSVRKLVRKAVPSVTEEVKYGGVLFTAGAPFCGVFAYTAHVSVEFSHGASIADPWGHLEGGGKGRRHLKLSAAGDVKAKRVADYVPLAWEAAMGAG